MGGGWIVEGGAVEEVGGGGGLGVTPHGSVWDGVGARLKDGGILHVGVVGQHLQTIGWN